MALSLNPVNLTLELPKLGRPDSAGGGYPLYPDRVNNQAWCKDVFSDHEIDAIIRIGEQVEFDRASTGGGITPKVRDSFVSFLFPNDVTGWIFEKMSQSIVQINDQFFGFDLTCMEQGLQFTRYSAPGEHYDWHIDRGGPFGTRKLSMTMQLSDPKDYEGGDLELWFGGGEDEILKADKSRGMMTFFPSWVMHRVKPVTKGVRYSLVAWISGPSFK